MSQGTRTSSDRVQLTADWGLDPPWETLGCGLDWPAAGGHGAVGTYTCCPAKGPCSQPPARCYCSWSGHGRMACYPRHGRGLRTQAQPPRGACSGSRVTVRQYLSVCVDNQRINDSCFFTQWLVQRIETCPPAREVSLGENCSGQDTGAGPVGRGQAQCPA